MTAAVGTAPERMLGERYNDQADVISFGVLLFELDVHTLPYARAKKENGDFKARAVPDSFLMPQVAVGVIAVEFSDVQAKGKCRAWASVYTLNSTLAMISPLKDIAIATVLGLGCGLAWNKFKDREMDRISRFYKWYDAHEAQKKNAYADD
ncbi:hypothetical protein PsorP6_016522 [Peronosclerospora sorghi]|uniref:Uncharacterized protein n=1 Tax=Peronosclerospora sorghi TaxID=230839 RepID=A0ACC0VIC3_9STRA|nr:hypothetical protein PsorP6_016522 [Peronosclerospora sorghi]